MGGTPLQQTGYNIIMKTMEAQKRSVLKGSQKTAEVSIYKQGIRGNDASMCVDACVAGCLFSAEVVPKEANMPSFRNIP